MKRFHAIVAVFLLSVLLGLVFAQTVRGGQPEPDIVAINGPAYWANPLTGSDFGYKQLTAVAAHNPTRAIWQATQKQNERYLAPTTAPLPNIQVSHSGIYTYASHPLDGFSEVMVSIDPNDPNHLLGGSKFFFGVPNYTFYTGVFESYDEGLTWSQHQPAGLEVNNLTSDPVTAFDNQSNGYFTILTVNGGGPDGIGMLKKAVGGPWGAPVSVVQAPGTDKQWIIADQNPQGISPYAGNVYVCWASTGTILFSRSSDGNQSWSSALPLNSPGDVQACTLGVAPDGTVYIAYLNFGGWLAVTKSTDGGVSFTSPITASTASLIPFYLPNSTFRSPSSLPSLAVSPVDGRVYLAWADYRNGDADIYLAQSSDGVSWSAPTRLNDDPLSNGIDQFQAQITVAPNGRLAVMWFDRRLNCPDLPWVLPERVGLANNCIDTFMTRSYDGGQSWVANIRASAQTWDWSLNLPLANSTTGFIGDYQGIAANNDYDFPFWNATANLGENAANEQQVFVARVPAIDLSPSTKTVFPAFVQPSGTVTYTIVLSNTSPEAATAVALTDTLPLETNYVANSLSATAGTAVYTPATRTVTWMGTISAGLPVTVTFRAEAKAELAAGTLFTNAALISDGVGGVYERRAAATIIRPDLATSSKEVSPTEIVPGEPLTYTILVKNTGSARASAASMSDRLPANTTFVPNSLSSSAGTAVYDGPSRTISWEGAVNQNQTVTISFQVISDLDLAAGTAIVNTADLSDGLNVSYQRSATASIIRPNFSTATKTVTPGEVVPGGVLAYTITLPNSGSAPAAAATVTDVLPANTTFVANSLSSSAGTAVYDGPSRTITWNGSTAVNQTITISFQATVASSLAEGVNIVNTAAIYDGLSVTVQRSATASVIRPNFSTATKTVTPGEVVPGGTLAYTITLPNSGSAPAAAATVTDVLPANTIFVANSLSSSAGTAVYDGPSRTITWNGSTAVNQTITISFQATVASSLAEGVNIVNTAAIYDGLSVTVQRSATASVIRPNFSTATKTVTPGEVVPGGTLAYTITLPNSGSGPAAAAMVTDVLPANTTFVANSLSSSAGTAVYDSPSRTITWNGPTAVNQTITISFQATVASSLAEGVNIVNTAAIYDGLSVTVQRSATASVIRPNFSTATKTVTPGEVVPGGVLAYTITLHNGGSAPATAATVTDVLPANTTFVANSLSSSAGTAVYDGPSRTITWNGSVNKAQTVTISFQATAASSLAEGVNIVNTAAIYDGLSVTVQRSATASVIRPNFSTATKTVTPGEVVPGGTLAYTITLPNSGSGPAAAAMVTDVLPANTTFVANSLSSSAGTAVYDGPSRTITWNGSVNKAQTVTISFQATPAMDLPAGTAIVNTAVINDGLGVTYQRSATATVIRPNLAASAKVVTPGQILPGGTLDYTIHLENSGTAPIQAGRMSDVLPANTTFVNGSLNSSSGSASYSSSTRTVSWSGTINAGQGVTVQFKVTVGSNLAGGATIVNTATIEDGLGNSIQRSATATVVRPNLVASGKEVNPAQVIPNQPLTYAITLRNSGTAVAQAAQVTDVLPANTTFVNGSLSSSTGSASYSSSTRTITWNGAAQVGQPVFISFQVVPTINLAAGASVVNTAVIRDGLGEQFERLATATIIRPDLSNSTKQVNLTEALPGTELTYTILLRNAGTAVAQAAEMTDLLSSQLSFVPNSLTASSGSTSYDDASRTIRWNGSVQPGQTVTVVFQAAVALGNNNGDRITNGATIQDGLGVTTAKSVTTTVIAPDLSPSDKSRDAAEVAPGEQIFYTITVKNNNPTAAPAATVTDVLPAGVSYLPGSLAFSSGAGMYDAATRTVNWAGVAAKNTLVVITFGVQTDGSLPDKTEIRNMAAIADGVGHSYERTAVTTIAVPPDLSTSAKLVEPLGPAPGAILTYQVVVGNASPAAATNASAVDTLPNSVSYVSGSLSASSGSASYDPSSRTITWNGQVNPNSEVTIRFQAQTNGNLSHGTQIKNTAIVYDGRGMSYDRWATVTIVTLANLSGSLKTVQPATVKAGEKLSYTIELANSSPTPATSASVLDTLPNSVSFVAGTLTASSGNATYNASSRTVAWSGAVNQSQPVTIAFEVRVAANLANGAVVVNTAIIDDGLGGTFERLATAVVEAPDLSATQKLVEPSVAKPGEQVTYSIVLQNKTATAATHVSFSDVLPAGVSLVPNSLDASSGSASYNASTRTVSWQGAVDQAVLVTVTFRATVDEGLPDGAEITNTAVIDDGRGQQLERLAILRVSVPPSLGASSKTADKTAVLAGGIINYTIIVANSSPTTAVDTAMSDVLPTGTNMVAGSLTASAGTAVYHPDTRTVSWSGTVAQGQPVTIAFQVLMADDVATGTVMINTAVITDGLGQSYERSAAVSVIPVSFTLYLPTIAR